MSEYVTCGECKGEYLKADGINEDALIPKHECPGSVEKRLATLEQKISLAR